MGERSAPLPRTSFRGINHALMVPALRAGLGPLLVNPISGHLALLETTGRKSGRVIRTPVSYAIFDGAVYVASGWNGRTDWYRNLRADPRARIGLPGRTVEARAEMVDDPDERARACHAVLDAAGLPGKALRSDVLGVDEATFRARTAEDRVVRFRVAGLTSGPFDPGGLGWVATWAAILALLAILRRRRSRNANA